MASTMALNVGLGRIAFDTLSGFGRKYPPRSTGFPCAGLEKGAAVHERYDGEHLRAGAELEDREQVRVVVTQDVAGHRDRVLAGAHPLQREARGFGDGHDADIESAGVVVSKISIHL